jgi:hypothetical protein
MADAARVVALLFVAGATTTDGQLGMALAFPPLLFSVQSYVRAGLYAI